MTEHKSRKKLIRERMARTGESYSTAHRHVVTTRTAAVPTAGLVPGYPAFGVEHHQPSALSRHLLAQSGLDLSEAMTCGLGGGIGFLYAVFEYKALPYPLLTIVAQHHPQPWLQAVSEHLKVRTSMATSSTEHTAIVKLDSALDAGHPALIVVGRGLLPWNEGVSELEAADAYPVVVAGRRGGEYLIDDRAAEPRVVDRETLGRAWAAHRKGRFAVTVIEELPREIDLPGAIRAALHTTADHLTGPVLGNSFDVNMGLSGIAKFVTEVRDPTRKTGWRKRFSTPAAFAAVTGRLAECLTWQYTAPGGTRPLYAAFLTEAAAASGWDLLPAARCAGLSGDHWTQLADLAGAADDDDDPGEVFDAIADLAAQALDLERLLVDHIRDAIE